ncbi:hypothetical protein K458DRAFT_488529 [Lentithecium fluviatile CBS 122367]|uniref:F-box domain-containing protein n=1 Tax=Lentithecium fluviatile CBS 122367 TaxID=1168545 RepID=A0A6G1IX19_9PLEO|nr:hypothetical protein K458DRAFT_488529 [Lentithecium fluviatile CBS 122367]
MSSPISTLPVELFLDVVKYLRHHDLAQLARVSSQYHSLIEPVLWTHVELHRFSLHEDLAFRPLREQEAALQRPYQCPEHMPTRETGAHYPVWGNPDITRWDLEQHRTAMLFLDVFSEGTTVDRKRAERLASLVRWLCLPVNGWTTYYDEKMTDTWNALAMFVNLEYLEISAYWRPAKFLHPFRGAHIPMSMLKTLKLRGYIPAEFVQFACANTAKITQLQLAIIDTPIGSNLPSKRGIPASPVDPEDETEEDFDHERIAPRPLACLSPSLISSFSSLEGLSLCRPCEGPPDNEDHWFNEIYHSIRSDEKVLKEWASLIRSTREMLTHLTLDQRPVAYEDAPDGMDSASWVDAYCNGEGYQRFVAIVLPVLLEDAEWPALKCIRIFGFESDAARDREDSVDMVQKLQQRFGNGVPILNGRGRWMLMWDDSGEIASDGDILDSSRDVGDDEGGEPSVWQWGDGKVWGEWKFGRRPRLG